MYNIYDILEEMDFTVVNEDLECVKMYDSNKIACLNFFIKDKGDIIFDYSPRYNEIYKGSFNKEAVEATVKDILNDLDREIKEQTGIRYIISKSEIEWKDKYGV